ncbi:peptidylprolyl isomerase [Devosia sp. PTR5]|uniref:Parvulin-like PPIase n=1 Tax=Devosia oryzisoli TaxID=2774138 RepID=A0A927FVD9_9HYPH|nr:peptidylprolyl isomerase [Devosia oryzisoli]MBD8067040.1 peptidylprolyl isomerase [Devosia oryzisoli]
MPNSSLRLVRTLSLAALLAAVPALGAHAQDAAAPEAPATTEAPATAPDASAAPAAPDAAAAPAAAPAPVSPDTVVATVGGQDITEADLSFAAEDMAQDLQQMPPDQRRPFLLRVLIDMKVMSNAAREAGMDKTELFAKRLNYLEERALRRAYFAEAIAGSITEQSVRDAYDAYVADFKPQEEVHASHILVETEDEAKAIKAELDGGADFAAIAKEKSIDPGAANGGDLGFFSKGMMVPPFEEAAFALEPGQVSDPVQSQFGWHIIKLEEKRQSEPPAFEQVAQQLQQQALMKAFGEKVDALMSGVEIDIKDSALAAALDDQQAGDAAAQNGDAAGMDDGAPATGEDAGTAAEETDAAAQ